VVDAFLDTAIVVDILRNYAPALQWINAQGNLSLGISSFVHMEVVDGAINGQEQRRTLKILNQFDLVFPMQADLEWAMAQQVAHRLKFGVGVLDCLIAAPAYRLQLLLYTQNVKHFQPLLGALAQKPY
jgi:predicted nucleic acid-binding protein